MLVESGMANAFKARWPVLESRNLAAFLDVATKIATGAVTCDQVDMSWSFYAIEQADYVWMLYTLEDAYLGLEIIKQLGGEP